MYDRFIYCDAQQSRFADMSKSIISRIDAMGDRIDTLEKSISELMQEVSALS